MEIKTFHSKCKNFLKQRRLITINLLIIVALVILNNLFAKFEVRFLNTFIDPTKDIDNLNNPIDRIIWFNNLEDNEFIKNFSPVLFHKSGDLESDFKPINSYRTHYNDNTIKCLLNEMKKNSKIGVK